MAWPGCAPWKELFKLAPDAYHVTVFGAEPHPNYNRILLSPVLAGEQTLDEIILNPLSWYQRTRRRLHLNRKVTRIDPPAPGGDDDGTEAEYDRLLLATGSEPVHLADSGKRP